MSDVDDLAKPRPHLVGADRRPVGRGAARADRLDAADATPRACRSCTRWTSRRELREQIERRWPLPAAALGRDPGAVAGPAPLRLVLAGGDPPGRRGDGRHPGLPGVGGELLRPVRDRARSGRHRILVCTQHLLLAARRRRPARGVLRGDRRGPPRRRPPRGELARRGVLRQGLRVPGRLRHRADGLDRRALLRPARAPGTPRSRSRQLRAGGEPLPTRRSPSARPPAGRVAARAEVEAPAPEAQEEPGGVSGSRRDSSSATSTSRGCATIEGYRRPAATGRCERAFTRDDARPGAGELEDSGLRGRGGAGFSMGKKASVPAARRDGEVPVLQRGRVRARAPSRTAS